jgi:zinc protease
MNKTRRSPSGRILAAALLLSLSAFGQHASTTAPKASGPVIVPGSGTEATVRTVRDLPSYKNLKFPPLKPVSIPHPTTFTLPNGMKIFLLEDHELPLVSGFALIRTGNLFDPPDKRGLADLTGTVLRSGGTRAETGDQIDVQLENVAASIESGIGENNGTLSFSTLRENTDQVLKLFHDFLTSAEFREDKVDLAKTQMRSEISRRNDDPGGVAEREFASIIYGRNNPYGWEVEYADVDNIHRDDLVRFYKRYYFPANIMLAVYGDFSTAEMRAKLEKLFGGWDYKQPAVPPFPALKTKPAPGVYLGEKNDVTQTFFEVGHLGGLFSDKDYPALAVAVDILGSGFTSRLMAKIRTELGYAYNIGAVWGAGFYSPGLFEISGSTKSPTTVQTLEVIRQEVEKLRQSEVSDQELRTAKDMVLNGFVFNFDRPSKTLNRMVLYEYYGYPKDFIFQYQKAIGAVTRADVLRVVREYLKPENLTIVAVGNPRNFGESLTSLHLPVTRLDLTIPEPKQETAKVNAASLARGKQLLEKAQTALGGAAKLEGIKDLTRKSTALLRAGPGMKASQITLEILPDIFREDQQLPFGKLTVYADGKTGWMATPQGIRPMPSMLLKQVSGQMFRDLITLLLSDRDLNRTVNAAGAGVVEISDKSGDLTRLTLDPATGLPLKQTYSAVSMGGPPQEVVETYSNWQDVNGIKLPFQIDLTQGGKPATQVTVISYQFNTGLKQEDLKKRP